MPSFIDDHDPVLLKLRGPIPQHTDIVRSLLDCCTLVSQLGPPWRRTTQVEVNQIGISDTSTRSVRLRYAIFTMLLMIISKMVNTLPIYRDVLQNYLSIGDDTLGLIFSMTGLGAISVLIGGAYSDRYGPRKVMRFCFVGNALAFFCFAATGKSWVLVAVAVGMHGLFNRPLGIAVNAYLIRLFPKNKRRALSFNLAGSNVGSMFIPAMAEGLLGISRRYEAVSFAAIFHIPFAIAGLLLIGGSFFHQEKPSLGGAQQREGKSFHLRDMAIPRRFVPIVAFMLLHGMGDTALIFWLPRYLTSGVFESVTIAPGYLITGHAVAYLLARAVTGLIPERHGRKWLLICPGLLGGSVFIAGILSGNYLVTAGAFLLGSFLWSAEYPVMLALLGNEIPHKFGAALGLHALLMSGSLFFVHNGIGLLMASIPVDLFWLVMVIPAAFFVCVGAGNACWLLRYGRELKNV